MKFSSEGGASGGGSGRSGACMREVNALRGFDMAEDELRRNSGFSVGEFLCCRIFFGSICSVIVVLSNGQVEIFSRVYVVVLVNLLCGADVSER